MEWHSEIIARSLARLLTPLVRILLHYGIPYGAFSDVLKQVYVSVAERDFSVAGRSQTTSRIAVVTGLHRKEVARLRRLPTDGPDARDRQYNRAARVLTGWLREPEFRDPSGQPRPLAVDADDGFPALVRRFSGDMPVRAVLDELERTGAVIRDAAGTVRPTRQGYVPADSEVQKLQILGTDTRDLIATIEHNLRQADTRFQRKVSYDNVPVEHAAEFRALAAARGQALLEELDRWLAARDRDSADHVEGSGRVRLGLGIHQIEEHRTDDAADGERDES